MEYELKGACSTRGNHYQDNLNKASETGTNPFITKLSDLTMLELKQNSFDEATRAFCEVLCNVFTECSSSAETQKTHTTASAINYSKLFLSFSKRFAYFDILHANNCSRLKDMINVRIEATI